MYVVILDSALTADKLQSLLRFFSILKLKYGKAQFIYTQFPAHFVTCSSCQQISFMIHQLTDIVKPDILY